LGPQMVGVARQLGVRAVAQVGAQGRPGVDGAAHLLGSRGAVAEGDAHAPGGGGRDVVGGAGPLGGEGDDADETARGLLPATELADVGVAQMAGVMGPAGPVIGRQRGPFDMDPGDGVRQQGVAAAGRGDHRQHVSDLLLARGDHGGQICGHALGPQGMGQLGDGLDIDVVVVDVMTGVAVDLQIDQARLRAVLPAHRLRPPERSPSGSWAAAATSRWTTTSEWVCMELAGTFSVTGPVRVAATASAFASPSTVHTRERADRMAGTVRVRAWVGTSSTLGNSPSSTCCWREVCARAILRTREESSKSVSPGSLKAIWPLTPIPRHTR